MRDICPLPLLFLAVLEARRYKWEKSKQEGKDLGNKAIAEWFKLHWKEWFNAHWVEHLQGKRFYDGFAESEFNITTSSPEGDSELTSKIVEFLQQSGNMSENLGIVLWSAEFGKDMNQVMKVLRKIDINSKRYIWDDDTLQRLCNALLEAEKHKWIESQKAQRDLGDDAIRDWFLKYWNSWLEQKGAA
jgi:hypothetical protein